jgi:hypothetical protein
VASTAQPQPSTFIAASNVDESVTVSARESTLRRVKRRWQKIQEIEARPSRSHGENPCAVLTLPTKRRSAGGVNLAGMRVGSVVFHAAVTDAVGTIVRPSFGSAPMLRNYAHAFWESMSRRLWICKL